ncbi:MAG: DUF4282 domain-containing protein [Brevundimonas sp.]|nr:MAG: DUF4282 domain-containing protein [Brevundimonas sp.]
MPDGNTNASASGGAQGTFSKFSNFDHLIGNNLIKILYYIGLVAIGIGVLVSMFQSFGAMKYSFGMGMLMLILSLFGGVVGVIFWRFICELYILAYLIYDRMGEIRDRLKS